MNLKKHPKSFIVILAGLSLLYYFLEPKNSIRLGMNQEQGERQVAMEPTNQPVQKSRPILNIINEENEVNYNALSIGEKSELSKMLNEKGFSLKEEGHNLEIALVPSEEVQASNQSTNPNFALESYSEETYKVFSQAILKEVNESETEIQLTPDDQAMIDEVKSSLNRSTSF